MKAPDPKPSPSRRKKGKGPNHFLGRPPKTTKTVRRINILQDVTEESSSSAPTTDSELSMTSTTATAGTRAVCTKSVNEPHLCSESEGFQSETTASELTATDLEEKGPTIKKRRRRVCVSQRKKYAHVKRVFNESLTDSDSESTADEEQIEVNFSTSSSQSSEEEVSQNAEENTSQEHHEKDNTPDLKIDTSTDTLESNPTMQLLLDNMKLVLSSQWSSDVCGDTLRLFIMNQADNPIVEKSIIFSKKDNSIGVFCHGAPVQPDHKILQPRPTCDVDNIGAVSDIICTLASRVQTATVCDGIQQHKEFWTFDMGYLDYSQSFENPTFRSDSCLLFMDSKRSKQCTECRHLVRKLDRHKKSSEREKEDPCSTRDKDLSKAGMKIKKDKYKKMAKHEKQRADRLQNRVESLKIKLDEALKDELLALLKVNQHKMSEVQRAFWLAQLKAMDADDKRGLRWDPMLIRIALHLHSLSPNAYEFFGDSKLLALPSRRRLFDYSHFIDAKEGCQKELLLLMKNKADKCGEENHYKFINLMFDEMHVKSGLVTLRSTGELIGFTKLSGIDEELAKIQHEITMKTYRPRLAKKVLVYIAVGITSNVKDVVAVFTTDDLSAHQLYDKTWDVIYHLEEVGLKVLTLTFDGASVNRKFVMMHESLDKSAPYTYCTTNLAAEDLRPLFFIVDPPHLIKTLRNALANSFSHRRSRKLWKNGEFLSWKVIEEVYEITKAWKNTGHKMKKCHIKLSSFSVMTVLFATQVLSNSTAKSIEDLSAHPNLENHDTKELILFIRLINRLFDCLNSRSETSEGPVTNLDKEPYCTVNDSRLSFLEIDVLGYFEEWKKDITERPGIFTETERSRMIISHQALGALQITIRSITSAIRFMLEAGAPSVGSRVFNQDPAEQYFAKLRRKQGDGNNPLVQNVLDSGLSFVAQGHVAMASSTKANVQSEKRKGELEMDSSPLPSRKISRKSKE